MRLNHSVATLAIAASLAFASSAMADGFEDCLPTDVASCELGDPTLCLVECANGLCGGLSANDSHECFVACDANCPAFGGCVAFDWCGDGLQKGIPATSEWGLAIMGLLMLTGGTITFRRYGIA